MMNRSNKSRTTRLGRHFDFGQRRTSESSSILVRLSTLERQSGLELQGVDHYISQTAFYTNIAISSSNAKVGFGVRTELD